MPNCIRVRLLSLSVLVLLLGSLSCTINDPQVGSVGAVSLLPVNPASVSQSVILAPGGMVEGNRVQTTLWKITRADLFLPGTPLDEPLDLLFVPGEDSEGNPGLADCRAIDAPNRLTINFGDCVESLVLEAAAENAGVTARLELDFSMRLKRVIPIVHPLIGDADEDGILNGNDNCVLAANPDQEDTGSFGLGDACRVVDVFAGVQLDSDGDGVPDTMDNCVHVANPDQANPPSPGDFSDIESVISDGIGAACEDVPQINDTDYMEQIIDIAPTTAMIPFDFVLPNSQGFVLVDFNDAIVAPDCDWDMGTCNFKESEVRACIRTNAFEASLGCI